MSADLNRRIVTLGSLIHSPPLLGWNINGHKGRVVCDDSLDRCGALQEAAPGPVRGKLFRDCRLDAERFAALDQLKGLEPLAVERVGLD
ncbi:hypothetical protein WR25_08776 [Diploscapter pachys]|uniref:Uncharacterized protein n=1 Tax=Diploscapter pachys TaxID=2018661 RepID=A0A2A2JWL5_9BILA|nr:hypothetical protein WR25_08776 [Diploscapter pachys]